MEQHWQYKKYGTAKHFVTHQAANNVAIALAHKGSACQLATLIDIKSQQHLPKIRRISLMPLAVHAYSKAKQR